MYTLRANAVFETKEELQELFAEIMQHIDNFDLDDHPNVGYDKLDFDILPFKGDSVYQFINMSRLNDLLKNTQAIDKYEDLQNVSKLTFILKNLDQFISQDDINYEEIVNLLIDLINSLS